MNWRLCVAVVVIVVAASSYATSAEKIETSPEEVSQLLKTAQKMIEEGKLDEAETVVEDALKRFWEIRHYGMERVDKTLRGVPFNLAEKWKENAKDKKARARALKWYEIVAARTNLFAEIHLVGRLTPSFRIQQRKYAYVLEMALRECDNDPDKVREKYPGIAEAWSPLLAADLDGDGKKEIVTSSGIIIVPTTIYVFFLKQDDRMLCLEFRYDYRVSSISVSDDDKDGKDEIVLRREPKWDGMIIELTGEKRDSNLGWIQSIITVKYEDNELVKTDETVIRWRGESGNFPK